MIKIFNFKKEAPAPVFVIFPEQFKRVKLFVQIGRACLLVFLLCVFLLFLSKQVILADSVPFSDYAENYNTIKCYTQEEFAAAISELERLLHEKEEFFNLPENAWVKEFTGSGTRFKALSEEELRSFQESSNALNTFQFFSYTEEQARICILRRLDAAIAQDKFVDFCTKFKTYINDHKPPITFFGIEEFFYKHLKQPDLSPAETLFNKQLHNLYLRDLHRLFEQFEHTYKVKPNYFSKSMENIYMSSWRLQGQYNIPWDLALYIALKNYFADSIMHNLFNEVMWDLADDMFMVKSTPKEEYHEKLVNMGKIYVHVYSYIQDYNHLHNMLLVLRYHQKVCFCIEGENPVD